MIFFLKTNMLLPLQIRVDVFKKIKKIIIGTIHYQVGINNIQPSL